jgi:hypothetical protein
MAIGYQLSAISYQLSAISYQLSSSRGHSFDEVTPAHDRRVAIICSAVGP